MAWLGGLIEWVKRKPKLAKPDMVIATTPRIINVVIPGGALTKTPYIVRSIQGNILPNGHYMFTVNIEIPIETAEGDMVENYMGMPMLMEIQDEEQQRDTKLPNSGVV